MDLLPIQNTSNQSNIGSNTIFLYFTYMDKLRLLLNEKYNIPVGDYFKLKEEDKDAISSIIVEHYQRNLLQDPMNVYLYLKILRHQIDMSIQDEEYERVDIMNRCRNKVMDMFPRIVDEDI